MVLLSITPLLDGVLRLDIIAPFHTSGPPLLQFHLAIEQWGDAITFTDFSSSKCKADITLPISYSRFFKAICCDWGNGAVATAVVTKGLAQITLYVAVAATAKPRASWITIGQ